VKSIDSSEMVVGRRSCVGSHKTAWRHNPDDYNPLLPASFPFKKVGHALLNTDVCYILRPPHLPSCYGQGRTETCGRPGQTNNLAPLQTGIL
jgi:hypothetical protein